MAISLNLKYQARADAPASAAEIMEVDLCKDLVAIPNLLK
jgi:hypothetical protein